MEVKITHVQEHLLVKPEGRLDTVTSEDLRSKLEEAWDGSCDLDMDFTKVEYISSAGMRLLVALQKKAAASGHHMVIRNINSVVNEVFRISGFLKALTIV